MPQQSEDKTDTILIPDSGDFEAWERSSNCCIAVDWDGTCKDTMVPKWTQGFNLAIPEIWPELKPHQEIIDKVCYDVNLVEETAGIPRFVGLKVMMKQWGAMGLPVPKLEGFFKAVDHVEESGEQHNVHLYRKLQSQFGYNDDPINWSDLSDEFIEEAAKNAIVFGNCRETLEELHQKADVIVVSASKTEAVRDDIVRDGMTHIFKALLAQDFLPKKGILDGLAERYEKVVFLGDTKYDIEAAEAVGVPILLVRMGDEAASWEEIRPKLERFIQGEEI